MSVINQSYPNIEYIIIDGGSNDNTHSIISKYRKNIDKIVTEPDEGIYDAMNKGIRLSTGNIIGILNSDDLYSNNNVISEIVKFYKVNKVSIIFGNMVYFISDSNRIVRNYNAKSFYSWKLRFGWMPPHPATFIEKNVYDKYGNYSKSYDTGSDYDMFVRLLLKYKLKFAYIDQCLVKMRIGGATTSGINSIITTSKEMVKALKYYGYYSNIFLIYLRLPLKIFEIVIPLFRNICLSFYRLK